MFSDDTLVLAPKNGKRYMLRNGAVVGPVIVRESDGPYPVSCSISKDMTWTREGHHFMEMQANALDIVAEIEIVFVDP
jgi:hypothetical protein